MNRRLSLGELALYAALYAFAMWGWHKFAQIINDPTNLGATDKGWILETFFSYFAILIIYSVQRRTDVIGRVGWGVLFLMSLTMALITFSNGWVGVLTTILMKVPIIGTGVKAVAIISTLPKAMWLEFCTLVFGHFSGIIRVTIPDSTRFRLPFIGGWDDWTTGY